LQVIDPAPAAYTSATVGFLDEGGSAIPGVPPLPLGADGAVSLVGLALTSTLPQFVITFDGLTDQAAVTVELTWTATEDESCLASGAVIPDPPATTTTTTTTLAPAPTTPATTAPAPAPTAPPGGVLPPTGSDGNTAALAALFTMAGIGLVWTARRRRAASLG
jgi:LPXTG-motif cell wall-anchored protein